MAKEIDSILLSAGLVWIGFDDTGRSIAASIEREKPGKRRGSTMHGCANIMLCKAPSDGILFGRQKDGFTAARPEAPDAQ